MESFEGKTAVITGGASGIGKAIAAACLAEGMCVVLADIEETVLADTCSEFDTQYPDKVLAVTTDVGKEEDLTRLRDTAFDHFGGVHLLCNNAGVGAGGGMLDATLNDWKWTMDVNLWSVINGCRLFLPRMVAQDTPCHIVNTASAAGLTPYNPSAAYTATKYAVVGLTENLHIEMKQRNTQVGVSVLCPGFVKTNIAYSGRNRPAELRDGGGDGAPHGDPAFEAMRHMVASGIPAEALAEMVIAAIRSQDLYITSIPLEPVLALRNNVIIGGGGLEPLTSLDDFKN